MQETIHTGVAPDVTPVFYTYDQVYNQTLDYFKGNDLQTNIWIDKYCLKDSKGNYLELTPDDMHKRLAQEFVRIEQKYANPLSYEDIYELLKNFKYIIPGGSILYGVGNNYSISSLGNCFVIGNNSDSYGGICTTDQEQAQLMKRRAGVGHDLSHLRPKTSSVSNSAGSSTGAVSFMPRYSNTTREVAQDGRRGALMLSMDINHLDIEDFITSKSDLSKITGANISVKIDDEFMKAVENNKDYGLKFHGEGAKNSGRDSWGYFKSVKTKPLWNKLIHQAWKSAEPRIWDLAV